MQAAGQGVKAAIDLVGAGVKIAQEGYEVAAPVIKQGVDAVAPVVTEAVKVTTETAAPLLQKATPVVKVRQGRHSAESDVVIIRDAALMLAWYTPCLLAAGYANVSKCRMKDGLAVIEPIRALCLCVQESLSSAFTATGVDVNSIQRTTDVVQKTATEGVSAAQPFLSQFITFITTTEPVSTEYTSTYVASQSMTVSCLINFLPS